MWFARSCNARRTKPKPQLSLSLSLSTPTYTSHNGHQRRAGSFQVFLFPLGISSVCSTGRRPGSTKDRGEGARARRRHLVIIFCPGKLDFIFFLPYLDNCTCLFSSLDSLPACLPACPPAHDAYHCCYGVHVHLREVPTTRCIISLYRGSNRCSCKVSPGNMGMLS